MFHSEWERIQETGRFPAGTCLPATNIAASPGTRGWRWLSLDPQSRCCKGNFSSWCWCNPTCYHQSRPCNARNPQPQSSEHQLEDKSLYFKNEWMNKLREHVFDVFKRLKRRKKSGNSKRWCTYRCASRRVARRYPRCKWRRHIAACRSIRSSLPSFRMTPCGGSTCTASCCKPSAGVAGRLFSCTPRMRPHPTTPRRHPWPKLESSLEPRTPPWVRQYRRLGQRFQSRSSSHSQIRWTGFLVGDPLEENPSSRPRLRLHLHLHLHYHTESIRSEE